MCTGVGGLSAVRGVPKKVPTPRPRGAGSARRRRQAAVKTFALTPLRSAIVLSLVFAASVVQVGDEETHDLVVAKFFGPRDQRSVAAHLVVRDRLCIRDDSSFSTA